MINNQLNEKFRKVGKITMIVLGLLIFGVSLYFNYLYLKTYLNSKKISNQTNGQNLAKENIINTLVSGLVNNVESGKIKIVTDGKDTDITIDEKTKFIKSYYDFDTLNPKTVDISLNDIQKNMNITVTCTKTDDTLTALKIEYKSLNMVYSIVESAANDKLVLYEINDNGPVYDKTFEIKLSKETSFFQATKKFNQENNNYDMTEMKNIALNDFNKGDEAMVFYEKDFMFNPDQSAWKIVLIKETK